MRLARGQQTADKAMIASGRQSVELAWEAYKAAGQSGANGYFCKLLQGFDAAFAQLPALNFPMDFLAEIWFVTFVTS